MQRLKGTDKSNGESMHGKENTHTLLVGLQTGSAIMGIRLENTQKFKISLLYKQV